MKQLSFTLDSKLSDRFPKAQIGVLLVGNLKPKKQINVNIEEIISNLLARISAKEASYIDNRELAAWLKIFSDLGLDTKEFLPSHVALIRRVLKSKQLVRINQLVDLYNIVSLKNLIPFGGHDLKEINKIIVGFSNGGEKYLAIGDNSHNEETVSPDIAAYLDPEHERVLTKNLVWRQADYSKITDNTKDFVVPIDDFPGLLKPEQVERIAMDFVGLLNNFYDFDYSFGLINRLNNNIELDASSYKFPMPNAKDILVKSKVSTDPVAIEKFFDRKLYQIYPNAEDFKKLLLSGKRLRFYIGADATAPLLHLGHLISFLKMAELQKLGHQIIFLIGDFTAQIGDPTDKSAARIRLTPEEVAHNSAEYQKQISKFIDFEDKDNPALLVFNSTWNAPLDFSNVISLAANFTVQQMLERDMFQKRLQENKPIYLHEFLYPLMQGYDSVFLEVDGEFGGTDQTFNMLAGRHLEEAMLKKNKFVFTCKLLLAADGINKMSKSIGNCIFINDPAQEKYGKIMSIPDSLLTHYYELVTNRSDAEIAEIKARLDAAKDPMVIKKDLAFEVIKMLDGEEAAKNAANYFERTIQNNEAPDDIPQTKRSELSNAKLTIKDLVVELGMLPSNAEAKRQITAGAVEVDNKKITDFNTELDLASVNIVKVGKLNWHKLID